MTSFGRADDDKSNSSFGAQLLELRKEADGVAHLTELAYRWHPIPEVTWPPGPGGHHIGLQLAATKPKQDGAVLGGEARGSPKLRVVPKSAVSGFPCRHISDVEEDQAS